MDTAKSGGANGLSDLAVTAHDHGRRLWLMLDASSLSDDEKAAWAALLPTLSLADIDRLESLLQRSLTSEIAEEFSDLLLKIKAAQAKHDLSADALAMKTEQELATLAEELTALEAR